MEPSTVVQILMAFYKIILLSNSQINVGLEENGNNSLFVAGVGDVTTAKPQPTPAPPTPLPALPRLASGLDITKLDLKNRDGGAQAGFRRPVLMFTFDDGKEFVNPAHSIRHLLPDQVAAAYPVPGGQFQATTIISKSVREWTDSTLWSLGLRIGKKDDSNTDDTTEANTESSTDASTDTGEGESTKLMTLENASQQLKGLGVAALLGMGSLSASMSYKTVKEVTSDESQSFLSTQGLINSFRYEFKKQNKDNNRTTLNVEFAEDVADLPKVQGTLTDAKFSEVYEQFIQNYGTHYFEAALFGGTLDMSTVTKKYLHKTMNQTDLKIQAGLEFKAVAANFGYNTDTKNASSEFTEKSSNNFEFFGGKAPTANSEGDGKPNYKSWQDWTLSVSQDPWLYKAELQSITNLIPDPKTRDILQRAIDAYIYRTYLLDIADTITRNTWEVFEELNSKRLEWIKIEVAKPLLQIKVDYNNPTYDAPISFKEDVKLCYEARNNDKYNLCKRKEFKTSDCVELNDWATIPFKSILDKMDTNYCNDFNYRLYLKTNLDVDFVKNGCFLDPESEKSCVPNSVSWMRAEIWGPPSNRGIEPSAYQKRLEYKYQKNKVIAEKLALCFNLQDTDPRLGGVEKDNNQYNLKCVKMDQEFNLALPGIDKRKFMSFSLRDSLHPV